MKRKSKKKQFRKKRIEKVSKKSSILPLLLFIGLLSLFSETMRTIPAGAISEKFINMPYELPKLNSSLFEKKYLNVEIPRPPHWKGYLLIPKRIEFWIGKENRLHDRFLYEFVNQGWEINRLYP